MHRVLKPQATLALSDQQALQTEISIYFMTKVIRWRQKSRPEEVFFSCHIVFMCKAVLKTAFIGLLNSQVLLMRHPDPFRGFQTLMGTWAPACQVLMSIFSSHVYSEIPLKCIKISVIWEILLCIWSVS